MKKITADDILRLIANPEIFWLPLVIAIAGGTSDARNDVLFTLFALVEIGEKLGTGLVQLFALWEQNGWPRPEFKEQFDPERTFLTLDYNDAEENTPQKTGTSEQVGNGSGPENNGSGPENGEESLGNHNSISVQYEQILACINDNSIITMEEIQQATGIAIRTIKRRLSELKQSGRLRRVGPDKGGHWEVLEGKQE